MSSDDIRSLVVLVSRYVVAVLCLSIFFFLMIRRPPRFTRTDTLFPYTTLFRSFGVPDLAGRSGLSTDALGRLLTDETLTSVDDARIVAAGDSAARSEEHTSELQSLMRISYAVFCLKKKTKNNDMYGETIEGTCNTETTRNNTEHRTLSPKT